MNFMKTILKACILINMSLLLSCDKDNDKDDEHNELYTEEQIQILDSKPTLTNVKKENILLPDGENLGTYLRRVEPAFVDKYSLRTSTSNFKLTDYSNLSPIEALKRFQGLLMGAGLYLCDGSKHADQGNGTVHEPKQEGIAYGWNLKDYTKRLKPDSKCNYMIKGLDCSGFLYNALALANVTYITGGSHDQANAETYQSHLRKVPAFKDVKVVRIDGSPDPAKYKSGDIIYWYKPGTNTVNHIGIIGQLGMGGLALFQSNGNPDDCDNNFFPKRGARIIPVTNPNYFKKEWGILKVIPDLSGKWQIRQLSASCGQLDELPPSIFTFQKNGEWTYSSKQTIRGINYDVKIELDPKTGLAKVTYFSSNGMYSGTLMQENIDLTSGRSNFTLNKIQSNPANEFCASYSVAVEHID
jgi:hypothetical protein